MFENKEWEAERKRHATIVDELNKRIPLDTWFIHFEVIRLDRQPSISRVVAWVKARIAELPSGRADATDPLTPWVTYATDGIQLRFRFRRRRSSSPSKPTDRSRRTRQRRWRRCARQPALRTRPAARPRGRAGAATVPDEHAMPNSSASASEVRSLGKNCPA